jgi:hypothetical protein
MGHPGRPRRLRLELNLGARLDFELFKRAFLPCGEGMLRDYCLDKVQIADFGFSRARRLCGRRRPISCDRMESLEEAYEIARDLARILFGQCGF